jgi:hypothetical protein
MEEREGPESAHPVIAGCSGKGRLTTPKPDGAEVKTSAISEHETSLALS